MKLRSLFNAKAGKTGAALVTGVMAGFVAGFYCGVEMAPQPAPAPTGLAGMANVYDGDTLTILRGEEKLPVRLYATDAPELSQTCGAARVACGRQARDVLRDLIGNAPVSCEKIEDRDRYGRYVAVCFNEAGQDLGQELIRRGLAVEYSAYSDGRYNAAQRAAQAGKSGIWATGFLEPAEWRRCFTGRIEARPTQGCPAYK